MLALKTAQWMRELGGVGRHDCIVVYNQRAHEQNMQDGVVAELTKTFKTVGTHVVRDTVEQKWPEAPNHCFIRVSKDIIQNDPLKPFLWLEPDAIPLKTTWLDEIEAEYQACGKPFMGDRVNVMQVPEHMSGVGVYKQLDFNAPNYVTASNIAWDVVSASQIIPKCHFTNLIQHEWKPEPFKDRADFDARIRKGAVIYHQDKSGSAIDILKGEHEQPKPFIIMGHDGDVLHDSRKEKTQPVESTSFADQIRFHCDALSKITDNKIGREQQMLAELRKRKLIPQAKRRK